MVFSNKKPPTARRTASPPEVTFAGAGLNSFIESQKQEMEWSIWRCQLVPLKEKHLVEKVGGVDE